MVIERLSLSAADTAKQSEVYKEPIWDIILSYTSVMSLFLSVLTIGGEFFSPDLSCYPPANVSITQAPFFDSWCSDTHLGRVSSMPLILLGQSFALYLPSLLFHHAFFSKIRQFFTEVKTIDRHRNSTYGTYSRESLNVVRLLRDQFKSSKVMKNYYFLKLFAQGLLAVWFGIFFALFYTSHSVVVHDRFTCTVQIDTEPMWSVEVGCVYPAALTLFSLWIANFVNLFVAFLSAVIGILLFNRMHMTGDYVERAKYYYYYGTTRVWEYERVQKKRRYCDFLSVSCDLHLLRLLLFDYDFGIGKSFEELLIDLELLHLKRLSHSAILDRSRRDREFEKPPHCLEVRLLAVLCLV